MEENPWAIELFKIRLFKPDCVKLGGWVLSRRLDAGMQHFSGAFDFSLPFSKIAQICKSRLYGASEEMNNGDMANFFCVTRDCPKISSVIQTKFACDTE